MRTHTEYIDTKDFPGRDQLEVCFYYDKGGYSSVRGFYLSIRPVQNTGNGIISWIGGEGVHRFIASASRYSEKQYDDAKAKAMSVKDELITELKEKHKISA